jgi:hypothetical protein
MAIKYLGTNEIGRSRTALAFPSVKTCQAIVYQTESHLYGFHDALANDTVFGKKAEVFRDFVQAHALNHATLAKCIIGVITATERFSDDRQGRAAWSTQLKTVATLLGFNGAIWGARVKEFINKGDSSYFRFDFHQDRAKRCMLSYQTWSRMEFSSNTLPKDTSKHALLRPQKVVAASFDERPYEMVEPTEDNRPVQMKGLTGEGVMIVVDDHEFIRLR